MLLLAATTPAGAADPGDCCADLEARIAELEATTARKGNRKVSVVISGTINQSALTWYDGKESNVYTVTNDNDRSRFSFAARATHQFGYLELCGNSLWGSIGRLELEAGGAVTRS